MSKVRRRVHRVNMKKLRRKRKRQELAKARDEKEKEAEAARESDPYYVMQQAEKEATEELLMEAEARRSERLHQNWLAREKLAQIEFQKKRAWERQVQKAREQQARKIQEEWEALRQREKEDSDRKEAAFTKKKEQQAALLDEARKQLGEESGVWHNPPAPQNYGTEQDKQNCPFFIKTGACRFGDRCSRIHPKPTVSCTLLLPGMFAHFSMEQAHRDEFDADIGLEFDDKEFVQHFRDFYADVLPEFKTLGQVVQFKVCRNHEPHLRGNVYVQYTTEEDAVQAFVRFNSRFYAGKQLTCEFSSVTKWKLAICGLYRRNRCPKGKNCNFLHVFPNPDNEFFEADRDLSPNRGSPLPGSTRSSYRSSTRHRSRSNSRRRSRDESHSSRHSSRRRSYSRDRSRERLHQSSSSSRSSRTKSREGSRSSLDVTPRSDNRSNEQRRRQQATGRSKPDGSQRQPSETTNGSSGAAVTKDLRTSVVLDALPGGADVIKEALITGPDKDNSAKVVEVTKVDREVSKDRRHKKSKSRHHKHKKHKSKKREYSSSSESS